MPCQNVHDGLPNYERAYSLRRMAAAVIRSMPRMERQAESRTQVDVGPVQRTATTKPDAAPRDVPARSTKPAQPTTKRASEHPALPRSPHRTYDDTTASSEQLWEHLRLGRRPGSRPRR
jgi:hypothetical protein